MLTVRFSRVGKKNRASYRLVLTESSAPVKGRFTELLGSYDPHSKKAVLKTDRLIFWKEKGVVFSDSVYNLLIKEGILKGAKRKVQMEKKIEEKPVEEKKEVTSEALKEEPKEEVKETPKEEVKEMPKEEVKEQVEVALKEEAKAVLEEQPKEESKEEAKEETKEDAK